MHHDAQKVVHAWSTPLAVSLLTGFLLFLAVSPAAAELTAAEKEVAIEIDGAIRDLEDGILAFRPLLATSRAGDLAMQRSMTLLHRAQGRLTYGLLRLLHIKTEPGTFPGGPNSEVFVTATDDWTAAQYTASALTMLDAGAAMLVEAKSSAPTAVTPFLDQARDKLRALDRTQTYEAPFPVDYPQILGPHGDWDRAQNRTAQALLNADTTMSYLAAAYAASDIPPTVFPLFSEIVKRNVQLQRLLRHGALVNDLIPVRPAEDCGLNGFHMIARNLARYVSMRSGTHGPHGAPYEFHGAFGDAFRQSLLRLAGSPVAYAQMLLFWERWTYVWLFSDGAAWSMLEFPDEARLAEIRAQARPLAPPSCP